jgi:hydrogenase-4 membrane subunit HyfE
MKGAGIATEKKIFLEILFAVIVCSIIAMERWFY